LKATKIFMALAATAAIALAVIGVAYGYYVNNQASINANSPYATNNSTPSTADRGFLGWFGGCLGFAPRQTYSYQYQPPTNSTAQAPTNIPPQYPYQPQNPNQGYYQYGYGRGCWGW
jgi:hypothetical protein